MQNLNKQAASENGGYDLPSVINSNDDFSHESTSESKGISRSDAKKANTSVQVSKARVF